MPEDRDVIVGIKIKVPSATDIKRVGDVIRKGIEASLGGLKIDDVIVKDLTKATKSLGSAQRRAATDAERLAKAEAKLAASLLPVVNATQRQVKALLRQQAVAGKTAEEVLEAAEATGKFSRVQLEAVKNVIRLRKELIELRQAQAQGGATADDVRAGLQRLSEAARRLATVTERAKQKVREQAKAQREMATAANQAEKEVKKLEQAQAKLLARLLPVNNAGQQAAKALLQEKAAAGATQEEILKLARASGQFDKATLEAVTSVARLENEIRELGSEFLRTGRGANRLETRISELNRQQKRFSGEAKKSGRSLIDFGAVATQVSSILSAFGLVSLVDALIDFGRATIRASIDFESSFTGIAKTTKGVVDDIGELTILGERLRFEFRRLAEETPLAITELNKIGELGGQLGIAQDALVEFTDIVARIAVTTDLTAEQAATNFARFGNVLQLTQAQLEQFASSVVELGNNTATTESRILNFSQRIAGSVSVLEAAAGGTQELSAETAGIAAAFTSVVNEVESGSTAVQKFLLSLNRAVAQGGDKLEGFAQVAGLSAEQFTQLFQADPIEAFVRVIEGLGESGARADRILGDLVSTDVRLQRAILSVANAGTLLRDSVELSNQAFEENNALLKESELRYGTSESAVQRLTNSWDNFKISLGDAAPIELAANKLAALLNILNTAEDRSRQLNVLTERLKELAGTSTTDLGVFGQTERLERGLRQAITAVPRDELTLTGPEFLPQEEQLRRAELAVAILENASRLPGPPPETEEQWRKLFEATEQAGIGVETYILQQKLLAAGVQGSDENLRLLAEAILDGSIALEQLPSNIQAVVEATNANTAATSANSDASGVNNQLQQERFELFLQGLGVTQQVTEATQENTTAQQQQAEAIAAVNLALAELANDSLPNQLNALNAVFEAQEAYNQAVGEDAVQAATNLLQAQEELTQALQDQFVAGLQLDEVYEVFGVTTLNSRDGILDLKVALGQLTEEQAGLISATERLNIETAQLTSLVLEAGFGPQQAAVAFKLLNLGIVDTAESAIALATDLREATLQVNVSEKASQRNAEAKTREARVVSDLTKATQAYSDALDEALQNALELAGNDLESNLLAEARAAGATDAQILDLVRSLGVLSEEEIQASTRTAELAQAQTELIGQFLRGEISSKEFARGIDQLARSADGAKSTLLSLGQAGRKAFTEGFAGFLGDSVSSGGGAGSALKSQADELDAAAKQIEEDAKRLTDATAEISKSFVSMVKDLVKADGDLSEAVPSTEELSLSLLDLSASGGAAVNDVAALALALGTLNEEQAQALLQGVALENGVKAIAKAFADGVVDSDQAASAFQQLQDQLAAGEAVDLGEFGIDVTNIDELSTQARALRESAIAAREAAEAAKEAAEASSGSANRAADANRNWALALLEAAEAQGATATDLLEIAEAAGITDENLLKAAISAGLMEAATGTLSGAISEIGGEEAAAQIVALQEALQNVGDTISAQDLALLVDISLSDEALTIEDINEAISILQAGAGDITVPVAVELAKRGDADQVSTLLDRLKDTKAVELGITSNVEDAQQVIDELTQEVEGSKTTLPFDADTEEAQEQVDVFLENASQEMTDVSVGADTLQAMNDVLELRNWIEDQEARVRIVTDSDLTSNTTTTTPGTGGAQAPSDSFATGGVIPGALGAPRVVQGHGGEGVLNTNAMRMLGVNRLNMLNSGILPNIGNTLRSAMGEMRSLIPLTNVTNSTSIDRRHIETTHITNNNIANGGLSVPPVTPLVDAVIR